MRLVCPRRPKAAGTLVQELGECIWHRRCDGASMGDAGAPPHPRASGTRALSLDRLKLLQDKLYARC